LNVDAGDSRVAQRPASLRHGAAPPISWITTQVNGAAWLPTARGLSRAAAAMAAIVIGQRFN
jgi:hypothetical protein